MATTRPTPRIGIALGGGAARGWAHIGILSALEARGIRPEIVCGTSIGALVGGIYAAGKLPELEAWVGSLTRRDVISLVDLTTVGGGMIGGRKLLELYREHIGEPRIEDLSVRFAAVATDLETGAEVWLRQGPLHEAIRASISIPGIFTPVPRDGRWLVDGALVNPVPVSVCRALGAEVVIAVDLYIGAKIRSPAPIDELARAGASRVGEGGVGAEAGAGPRVVREEASRPGLADLLTRLRGPAEGAASRPPSPPNVISVITESLDIVQDRLSRSRLAGDPPDLLLMPRVWEVPQLEFAGGQPTIDEGYAVVERMLPALNDLLGRGAKG